MSCGIPQPGTERIPLAVDAQSDNCWTARELHTHLNIYISCVGAAAAAAAAAKSLQPCLTLCDPIDSRPPGSPVPGILQARILEWVSISFSNA